MGEQCSEMLCGEGTWGAFHLRHCEKPPKVQVDGKWYCALHDPAAVKQRKEKQQAKWDAEQEQRKANYRASELQRKRDAALRMFCEGVDTETIETFVANGETLQKWMKEVK